MRPVLLDDSLVVKNGPYVRRPSDLTLSVIDCSLVYFSGADNWAILHHRINLREIALRQTLVDSFPVSFYPYRCS